VSRGHLHGDAERALDELARALAAEAAEARARTDELFKDAQPRALEARGVYLRRARIKDARPAMMGRARIVIGDDDNRAGHVDRFAARAGACVHLIDEVDGVRAIVATGVVARRRRGELEVVFSPGDQSGDGRDVADLDAGDIVDLLLGADEVTLRRLQEGVATAKRATGRQARLVELLLGAAAPRATRLPDGDSATALQLSPGLNDDQRRAALHALCADDVALIHGPPGTGKTHVVTAAVVAAVARGERVLCLCASNAAIDHLALELLAASPTIPLARLGDPARVHDDLEAHTLQVLTAEHPHRVVAKKLIDLAHTTLRGAARRSDTSREAHQRRREARSAAASLFAEARELERTAAADVLQKARVLCGTLTGRSDELRAAITSGGDAFDVVVVDEASQATTPALLLPLSLLSAEGRIVLAGDHRQLPPVVLSPQAGRLADTAFAALREADASSTYSHLLTVQHRMHEALMAFPSERFYDNKLVAHESVADRTLASAIAADGLDARVSLPSRVLDVIDTAGAGFDELRAADSSIENAGEARVACLLVEDLLALGLRPTDIGVITPYAAQSAALRRALDDVAGGADIEVDSVDGFQGREKRVIIVSATRSNADGAVGFLADVRRLNVAITRAKEKLVVIGDSATLSADPTWRALFDDAIARGAYRSVFEIDRAV